CLIDCLLKCWAIFKRPLTRTNILLIADFESYPFTMIHESLLAKVSSLSAADRLELIGVVWDTLSPDDLTVTDAERALLDARLADIEHNRTINLLGPKLRPA